MVEGNEDSLNKKNKGCLSFYVAGESATFTCTWQTQRQTGAWKSLTVGKRQTSLGSDWLPGAQGSPRRANGQCGTPCYCLEGTANFLQSVLNWKEGQKLGKL